jgi:hypothetical protein
MTTEQKIIHAKVGRFALGHAKLLSRASAQQRAGGLTQQRAATTQTPRRPIGAGGVRGASRSGSASVITTHTLFARKVQRKLSNGVAGFAAGGSSSENESDRGQFVPSRRRRMMANVKRLLKIPAEPSPELRIPGAAAQTRVVSMAGIRLGSGECARAFKGIICDDISEFESHMPSHAVGLSASLLVSARGVFRDEREASPKWAASRLQIRGFESSRPSQGLNN